MSVAAYGGSRWALVQFCAEATSPFEALVFALMLNPQAPQGEVKRVLLSERRRSVLNLRCGG
jgi:hypothetical protein